MRIKRILWRKYHIFVNSDIHICYLRGNPRYLIE
uniref:Uncharacterized protein n=1 Tax=virus sp. ct5rm7 TaxID=2827298 RepID=A0A8S5RGN2_9VIRU|nr:MAG TPA: hypothetical protein [virus sp. ct5rm7]